MILLDEVEESDDTHCICRVDIRPDLPFHKQEGVPAFVGFEYLAQTVGAYSGWKGRQKQQKPKVGFLLSVREYQATAPFFTDGTSLHIEVAHSWGDGDMLRFEGIIFTDDRNCPLAQGVLNVFGPENPESFLETGA